jgi:hypothetical protein
MGNASDANREFTDRVQKSYSSIQDPRLRSLVLALIRHLYGYVEQTELTDEEWEFAWNFMAGRRRFRTETSSCCWVMCSASAN